MNAEYCAKAGKLIRAATAARLNTRARSITFEVDDRVVILRDPRGYRAEPGRHSGPRVPLVGPTTVTEVCDGGMYVLNLGGSTYLGNVIGFRPNTGPATIRLQRFDAPSRGSL